MIRISRKKKILIFLRLTWISPTCVMLVGFHFIFVTKDDVVIYLHENMRIKQLLLKQSFLFRTDLLSEGSKVLLVKTIWNQITIFCCHTDPVSLVKCMFLISR